MTSMVLGDTTLEFLTPNVNAPLLRCVCTLPCPSRILSFVVAQTTFESGEFFSFHFQGFQSWMDNINACRNGCNK
jgi:hypothetical protein